MAKVLEQNNMKKGPFKMKGYTYPGTSPIEQDEHFLEKKKTPPMEGAQGGTKKKWKYALDEDGKTPGVNIRMEAAKQILDRVGLVKKEKIDINAQVAHGIFVLPAKDIVT